MRRSNMLCTHTHTANSGGTSCCIDSRPPKPIRRSPPTLSIVRRPVRTVQGRHPSSPVAGRGSEVNLCKADGPKRNIGVRRKQEHAGRPGTLFFLLLDFGSAKAVHAKASWLCVLCKEHTVRADRLEAEKTKQQYHACAPYRQITENQSIDAHTTASGLYSEAQKMQPPTRCGLLHVERRGGPLRLCISKPRRSSSPSKAV